jgi:hypothetical protein
LWPKFVQLCLIGGLDERVGVGLNGRVKEGGISIVQPSLLKGRALPKKKERGPLRSAKIIDLKGNRNLGICFKLYKDQVF